jgi:hypothetical protein
MVAVRFGSWQWHLDFGSCGGFVLIVALDL